MQLENKITNVILTSTTTNFQQYFLKYCILPLLSALQLRHSEILVSCTFLYIYIYIYIFYNSLVYFHSSMLKQGLICTKCKDLPCIQTRSGAHKASYLVDPMAFITEVRGSGHKADHSPPPSVQVKNVRCHTFAICTTVFSIYQFSTPCESSLYH